MVEVLSTWSPIFIAACALSAAIWSGFAQRKHNRLSVRPVLGFDWDVTGLRILNSGLGPARNCSIEASVDGQVFDLSTKEAATGLAKTLYLNPEPDTIASIGFGSYILQGAPFDFIWVHKDVLAGGRHDVTMELKVEYSSIYDEQMEPSTLEWRP